MASVDGLRQRVEAARVNGAPIRAHSTWRVPLPAVLASAAVVVAALGAGMPYDRVSPGQTGLFGLLATPLATLLAAAALALAFVRPGPHEERRSTVAWFGFFGVFLLWCALSLVRSRYLEDSLSVLAIFGAAAAVGVVAARAAHTREALLALLVPAVAAGAIVSGLGIHEYVTELRGGNPLWRVFAHFVNPDFLAGYLLLCIPAAVALFLSARDRSARLLAGGAVLLQAVCLVLTGSRLGMVALGVALAAQVALTLRSGALSRTLNPSARRGVLVVVAVVVAGMALAGRPLFRRLLLSGGQSYSAEFRLYTWRGAWRMAKANPLLGTGIGTFETAYPPYATVGYTQHAHDTYLQLMGETGLPGGLLLVAGIAATLLVGVRCSIFGGRDGPHPLSPSPHSRSARSSLRRGQGEPGSSGASHLLAAGLVAGILGAAVHNLFDSDLYVPATALTFGLYCGLLAALARPETSEAEGAATRAPLVRAGTWVGAALLAAFAVMVGGGRMQASDAPAATATGDASRAVAAYEGALSLDPLNQEYRLTLAPLDLRLGRPEEAARVYADAVRVAQTGKAYRQYGRLLQAGHRLDEAIRMYTRALALEPRNLQTMLALADAYTAANRPADAAGVYQRMVALYHSPYAAIRAMPELVDWEYGFAYAGLGDAAMRRGDTRRAIADYGEAASILGTFWKQRDLLIAQLRFGDESPVRQMTADKYGDALDKLAAALDTTGDHARASQVRQERALFQAEREKAEAGG